MSKNYKAGTVAPLHTSCKECIFASYNPIKINGDKSEQDGCNIGRLIPAFNEVPVKHVDPNIDIVEVYDDEQEFFVINNLKCHYKRTASWGNKIDKNSWQERVYAENRLKYQSIIFANNDIQNLIDTTTALTQQLIPPQYITIVRKPDNTVRPSIISDYLNTIELPWGIENVIDSEIDNTKVVDSILQKRSYPYYSLFEAGIILPVDLFESINTQIYDNNLIFVALTHNKQPVLVSTYIHNVYGGNRPTSIVEKTRENKCDNLLIPIQTVYPNYPIINGPK